MVWYSNPIWIPLCFSDVWDKMVHKTSEYHARCRTWIAWYSDGLYPNPHCILHRDQLRKFRSTFKFCVNSFVGPAYDLKYFKSLRLQQYFYSNLVKYQTQNILFETLKQNKVGTRIPCLLNLNSSEYQIFYCHIFECSTVIVVTWLNWPFKYQTFGPFFRSWLEMSDFWPGIQAMI